MALELQDMPEMKKSDSKLDILRMRLQQCQGENGMVDPARILQTMNNVQIEEDPEAYVPEIEKLHQRKSSGLNLILKTNQFSF